MIKERILIAEERPPLSARLQEIVEKAGYQAVLTQSGQVAVSRARVLRPALVLLSEHIGPPGASETARRIKEDAATENIPIVLLSTTFGTGLTLTHSYPVEACLPVNIAAEHLAHIFRFLLAEYAKHTSRSSRDVWPLEGTVDDGMLHDVLQFLFMSERRGKMVVSNGAQMGSLYFEGDRVEHAEFDGASGEDGFFKMCFLEHGQFRFEPDMKAPEITVDRQGRALLLEACRRIDTLRHDGIPSADPFDFSDWKPARRRAPTPQECIDLEVTAKLEPEPEVWAPPAPVVPPRRRKIPRSFLIAAAAVLIPGLIAAIVIGRNVLRPRVVAASVDTIPSWLRESRPIVISSFPDGARVRVDGTEVGETPLNDLRLQPGRYLFQLQKEGLEPLQQLVLIGAEEMSQTLHFNLNPSAPARGTLVLLISPMEARVELAGEPVADHRAPLALLPGEYRVTVKADGFDDFHSSVEVAPGGTRELSVRLKKTALKAAAAPPAPLPVEPLPVEPPVKVSGADAAYPELAVRQNREGTVEVVIEVDEQGAVSSALVQQSAGPILDDAVLDAVRKFKYRPATQGGVPMRHSVLYRQTFRRR